VIDGAVGKSLEILRPARRGDFGIVERVGHAHALDGFLGHAIDGCGLLLARDLKKCRHDVDYVVPLRPDAALALDVGRPRDDHPLAVPP